jgi:hypothetical protein
MPCDCKQPADSDPALRMIVAPVQNRVNARLDKAAARALAKYCSKNRCSQSAALRSALVHLASATDTDPGIALQRVAEALSEALGKPIDASPDAVRAATDELIRSLDAGAPPEASTPAADAPLSRAARSYCEKHNITAGEFAARKAALKRQVKPRKRAAR